MPTKRKIRETSFETVSAMGLALPEVEATTNWAGRPVLKARGAFMAGIAFHHSAEPGSLLVRCAIEDREGFLEDAPDTYYVTDYYRPCPLVLVRLSRVDRDALRELLSLSWRMAIAKGRRPTRTRRR